MNVLQNIRYTIPYGYESEWITIAHMSFIRMHKKIKKYICYGFGIFIVLVFAFYNFILYPKHFSEFEIWGSTPQSLPFFMFHENDAEELDEIFSYLKNNNYTTLNAQQSLDIVEGRQAYTGKEVVLTFDDGKLALWTVAGPKLQEYRFTGIAFVNPGKIQSNSILRKQHISHITEDDLNLYCTWEELKELQKTGLDIQSHSQHHERSLFYNNQSHTTKSAELLESLTTSKKTLIDKKFGKQLFFCAPYGSVSPTLIECSKKAGYPHLIGILPHEGNHTFYGKENDFKNRDYILRMNFRSILSLPGENRETVVGRLWRRISKGGDRHYK